MKTYDLYGARSGSQASKTTLEDVRRIASLVQEALGVDLFVRPGRQPYNHYRAHGDDDGAARSTSVTGNAKEGRELAAYPEFEHSVIVAIIEPANPDETRSVLESAGLSLLRRRRRAYVKPPQRPAKPTLEIYGASGDAASTVALLSPVLGTGFDGNEYAAAGADSYYYDESERFGTLLVFDNAPRPFDDMPFREYADFPAVLIAVNTPTTDELRDHLVSHGLTLLKTSGSEK